MIRYGYYRNTYFYSLGFTETTLEYQYFRRITMTLRYQFIGPSKLSRKGTRDGYFDTI